MDLVDIPSHVQRVIVSLVVDTGVLGRWLLVVPVERDPYCVLMLSILTIHVCTCFGHILQYLRYLMDMTNEEKGYNCFASH